MFILQPDAKNPIRGVLFRVLVKATIIIVATPTK